MSGKYKGFISQNCSLPNINTIGIYDGNGNRKGTIKVPTRMQAPTGNKLYSFGVGADAHTFLNASYTEGTTANEDFIRALNWYKTVADFLCLCGDLVSYGLADLPYYKQLVDENSGNMPVYPIAGNHEYWGDTVTSDILETYTGHPLCYTFEYGNDVFIMCGSASADYQFTTEILQWLYETLETNRNKRCFLFVHAPILGYSGDPTNLYPFDMLSGTTGEVFQNLLRHYKNTIYFHAHTHILYESQTFTQNNDISNCIYDNSLGIHSIHIPSLAIPIDVTSGSRVVVSEKSQGYLVDVYENEILLKGRDFIEEKYIATAI